ncbi:MAG: lycopene cyclase domain-containing protein [Bacteroidota bacterium]
MTYLEFHLFFILPPIVALAVTRLFVHREVSYRTALGTIGVLCAIALIYTTPWDNYLVARSVWWYSDDRVIGSIGYVPVEEYLFFILQPILAGLWLAVLPSNGGRGRLIGSMRRNGGLAGVLITVAGFWMLREDSTLYMGLILSWAGPVIAGQWVWFGDVFFRERRRWALGVAIPTLYLWVADRIAIGNEIWIISDRYTTGADIFGLPIEEAAFFLVTNLMVVQGLIMFQERRQDLKEAPVEENFLGTRPPNYAASSSRK